MTSYFHYLAVCLLHTRLAKINNKKTVTFLFLVSSDSKTITMQTKNWISFGFIVAILLGSLLLLNATTPKKEKDTSCKVVSKKCPSGLKNEATSEPTHENLSHQFIALPVILN